MEVEQAATTVSQWEYLLLEVVPWLDGWEYRPLDDKGNPLDEREKFALGFWAEEFFSPPGLNDFGAQGWEVAGVVPEMHLYDRGRAFHSNQETVLLLKRRKA